MKEKISIIIPVYNAKDYLVRCIDSVIKQTFRNLEIILVDDGSEDGSGEICDRYAVKDDRIRVFHKKNEGSSAARNLALSHVTGEYVGFLDSDDYVKENMFEDMYKIAKKYDADIVQCGHYIVKNDQIIEVVHGDGKMESYDSEMAVIEIMNDEKINSFVWDKLYKKELFHDFKYMELDYHEDVASTFKLIAKSKRVVCNNKPLYYYIRNPKSISHTLNPYKYYCSYRAFKEREEIIKEICPNMLEKNTVNKCTMGVTALNTMYREQGFQNEYKYQIRELHKEMMPDRNIIKAAENVPPNVRLYMFLLPYRHLYKVICRLNIHDTMKDK